MLLRSKSENCVSFSIPDKEEDPDTARILRHMELIDDEASEYGIHIVKMSDRLMAKKYGYREPPGLTYFRKGEELLIYECFIWTLSYAPN